MNTPGSHERHWTFAAAGLTAAALFVNALWIPVKAEVAQLLLARSWQQTLAGHPDAKPWPWADTRTVGILEVPRLNVKTFILEGSSGRNLAFGPTALNATPLDRTRDRILSGHRDTHFAFLKDLKKGDLLRLTTAAKTWLYRVAWLDEIDATRQQLVIESDMERLTLLTCYPFDALTAGGPMRWVVTAVPVES